MYSSCIRLFSAILILALSGEAANNFAGLTVSNSAGGTSTYTCRTQAEWNKLATDAANDGFKAIRILGFDCNALDLASSAAAAAKIQVLAGIFAEKGTIAASPPQIDNDVNTFCSAYAKYGAGRYVGLTIGNEVQDTPQNIEAKLQQVKSTLKSAGITTPVSTVPIWTTIRDNHVLCNGDFVGANAHAFYDGGQTLAQAGTFVSTIAIPALKTACPNKKIFITDVGQWVMPTRRVRGYGFHGYGSGSTSLNPS